MQGANFWVFDPEIKVNRWKQARLTVTAMSSPQKASWLFDLIRGKSVTEAFKFLNFTKKRVTHDLEKIVRSAIANAEQKAEHTRR